MKIYIALLVIAAWGSIGAEAKGEFTGGRKCQNNNNWVSCYPNHLEKFNPNGEYPTCEDGEYPINRGKSKGSSCYRKDEFRAYRNEQGASAAATKACNCARCIAVKEGEQGDINCELYCKTQQKIKVTVADNNVSPMCAKKAETCVCVDNQATCSNLDETKCNEAEDCMYQQIGGNKYCTRVKDCSDITLESKCNGKRAGNQCYWNPSKAICSIQSFPTGSDYIKTAKCQQLSGKDCGNTQGRCFRFKWNGDRVTGVTGSKKKTVQKYKESEGCLDNLQKCSYYKTQAKCRKHDFKSKSFAKYNRLNPTKSGQKGLDATGKPVTCKFIKEVGRCAGGDENLSDFDCRRIELEKYCIGKHSRDRCKWEREHKRDPKCTVLCDENDTECVEKCKMIPACVAIPCSDIAPNAKERKRKEACEAVKQCKWNEFYSKKGEACVGASANIDPKCSDLHKREGACNRVKNCVYFKPEKECKWKRKCTSIKDTNVKEREQKCALLGLDDCEWNKVDQKCYELGKSPEITKCEFVAKKQKGLCSKVSGTACIYSKRAKKCIDAPCSQFKQPNRDACRKVNKKCVFNSFDRSCTAREVKPSSCSDYVYKDACSNNSTCTYVSMQDFDCTSLSGAECMKDNWCRKVKNNCVKKFDTDNIDCDSKQLGCKKRALCKWNADADTNKCSINTAVMNRCEAKKTE